jgi:hypothetical protein
VILQQSSPDFVIITGRKPVIDRDILSSQSHFKALIFTSEVNENIRLPAGLPDLSADTVHIVGKKGAFTWRL